MKKLREVYESLVVLAIAVCAVAAIYIVCTVLARFLEALP